MNIAEKTLNKPKIIGVCADVNTGKSMLLYHILESAIQKGYTFNLYYYGLRIDIDKSKLNKAQRVYTVAELEEIRNSIIVIDELSSLFDLDNRKIKKEIENTLRLINHNNNILLLCGVPENFKKFISAKLDEIFLKKTTIRDALNGSSIKNTILQYKGYERGTELLNLNIDKALYYNGAHYQKIKVPYYKQYDSKKDNVNILQERAKNVPKNVEE